MHAEHNEFDRLVRRLVNCASRRGLPRAATTTLTASALAALGLSALPDGEAKPWSS